MFIYRRGGASMSNLAIQSAIWQGKAVTNSYPKTHDQNTAQLLPFAGADRPILIVVRVTEAFSDGASGTQPVFTIEYTGAPGDFGAIQALLVDAPKGRSFVFAGVLPDIEDLHVVGLSPATGTGTGAIKITSVVFPETYGV